MSPPHGNYIPVVWRAGWGDWRCTVVSETTRTPVRARNSLSGVLQDLQFRGPCRWWAAYKASRWIAWQQRRVANDLAEQAAIREALNTAAPPTVTLDVPQDDGSTHHLTVPTRPLVDPSKATGQ